MEKSNILNNILNVNLNDILKNKIKPNLTNYSIDELKIMIFNYFQNSNPNDNLENIENKNKFELDEIIIKLWNNYPISNNNSDIINCVVCFNPITNSDNLLMRCNHQIHSSCFFNYLFTNLTNNNFNSNTLSNLFRCPECRNYLTEHINNVKNQNNFEPSENVNFENIILSDNNDYMENLNIDLVTGLWTI